MPSKYRLEPLTWSDVPALVELATATFRELPSRRPSEVFTPAARLVRDHPGWHFKVTRGRDLVADIVSQPTTDGEVVAVHHLAVHPQHQRRGLGRRLLTAVEERASAEGYELVRLGTVYARGFYERCGYLAAGADWRLVRDLRLAGARGALAPRGSPIEREHLPQLVQMLPEDDGYAFLRAYYDALAWGFAFSVGDIKRPAALLVAAPKAAERIAGTGFGREPAALDLFATDFLWGRSVPDRLQAIDALEAEVIRRGARLAGVAVERDDEQFLAAVRERGYAEETHPAWFTLFWYEKNLTSATGGIP